MSTNKKRKNIHNKTIKNIKTIKKYCDTHANTFNTFEEEYEKTLSKNLIEADKDVEKENKISELKLLIPGKTLVAKKQCKSFEEATDLATEALRKQVKKHKEKVA